MTEKQEREALELVGALGALVAYPKIAKLVRKSLLARADKLLRSVDGTTKNELAIARANLKEI
jgi:hypothetical protein